MPASGCPETQQLYDAAACGLMLADLGGRLLRVNGTICRWLRLQPDQLLAMKFQDLLTVGGRIFYQTHIGPLLRIQGSVAEVKLEFRLQGSEALPVMVNFAEGMAEGKPIVHIAAIVATDRHRYERELLTERRRAEDLAAQYAKAREELAVARAQAEDRAKFSEQMVGIVSHDLRNPLSVISMSLVLLGMGDLTAQQRPVVSRIDRSVKRAERLVADLLDFTQARLGSGVAVKREPLDMHQTVGETVAELSDTFPERAIVHERAGPGACSADGDRIAQAVGNLVTNAVHYGDPERPITVRTEVQEQSVSISVHNEGPAIPAPTQEVLFEPMIRGTATGTAPRGVGLGLFIVRAIAKAHGGTAQVRSSVSEGSVFTLTFPRR
jgi:phosphoserine phosphatase RsbU/P